MQPTSRKTRVLMADDDQSIRQLVCTIIRREGLDVDCVGDGQEAIECLRDHDYAVILLDLMMPRMDGFEVIDYLRHHPPDRKPIVLVITAYADQKFKKVDPDVVAGVLRKPFEVAELGSVIRNCVLGFEAALDSEKAAIPPGELPSARTWPPSPPTADRSEH